MTHLAGINTEGAVLGRKLFRNTTGGRHGANRPRTDA
jgi:hypothetical protein